MAKKKNENSPAEKPKTLTETEKQILVLEKKLEELNSNILTAEKKLEELNSIAVKAQKMIKNIDCLFTLDLSKRYGFDQNNMYYIGTASNRIYKKPIDEEIVGLISRIDILDWREIQKINQHFMQ